MHEPHATMATRVLKRMHAGVGVAHHDDRLIKNFVFDEVVRFGNLFKATRHLPRTRPDLLGFELVELWVVVALLRCPITLFHRERHCVQGWTHCGTSFNDRHARPRFDCRLDVRCRGSTCWFLGRSYPNRSLHCAAPVRVLRTYHGDTCE